MIKNSSGLSFVDSFRAIPDELRPREKLAKYGASALGLWELVALILRTGERHKGGGFEDVGQLSRRLLAEAGFKGLFTQSDVLGVRENFGIYNSHAELIVAISEICRRIHGKYDSFDVSEPGMVAEKFACLRKVKQEQCHVLHVDKNKKCVFQEMVAVGGGDSVSVFPSDVLRTPLWLGTREIIVVHNHSGSSEASSEDVSWTLSLAKGALEFHNIALLDHVILGSDGYFSFAEHGLI